MLFIAGDEDDDGVDDVVQECEHFVILLIDGVVDVDDTVNWIGVIGRLIRDDEDGYDDEDVCWLVDDELFTVANVIVFNCFVWFITGFLFNVCINKWPDGDCWWCCWVINGVVLNTLHVFNFFFKDSQPYYYP